MIAMLAAAPALADGECRQWHVPPILVVTQGLGRITFQLKEEGTDFHGWAYYESPKGWVKGNVSGSVADNTFNARVLWTYSGVNAIGRYTGKITPRWGVPAGEITYGNVSEGYTYDEYDTNNYAYWSATHFICQDVEPPPRAAPAPPDFKENIDKGKHDAMNAAFETAATESASADRATAAAPQAPPPKALGRIQPRGETPAGPPTTMCEKAAAARAANRPTAAALQQRCDAEIAALPPIDLAAVDALAAAGAEIAGIDPSVASARVLVAGADYQRGFDVGTGLFGDPALGAQGNTLMGPGSARIRDSLTAPGQSGFNDSMKFHLARTY